MRAVRLAAHAKVNLTLDVLGRRADGYHELRSVFARVSLADTVRVSRSRGWRVVVRPPIDAPPEAELSLRAARELAARLGRGDGAAISVRKRIPTGAGLGGGSSDAAATLRALAALWDVADAGALHASAAATGSDVRFFLDGALAAVGGRGEDVRALPGGPWPGVLVLPRCRVATRDAYARLPPDAWSDGSRTAALVAALERGRVDAAALRARCGNAFDAVVDAFCPEVAALRAAAGVPLFLSGSGAALFAVADGRADALALRRRLRRAGARALAVAIGVPPDDVPR